MPHMRHMYRMKRTSLFLDDKITSELKRLARRRGISFATVVREALAAYAVKPVVRDDAPSLPSVVGRFTSGHADTSTRIDELLWRDPHA